LALELPDHDLSEERREFCDALRRFLEEYAPMTEVRAVAGLAVRAIEALTLVRRPASKGRDRQLAPGVPTRFSRRGMRLTADSGRISC